MDEIKPHRTYVVKVSTFITEPFFSSTAGRYTPLVLEY